jgi:hypothetical protein
MRIGYIKYFAQLLDRQCMEFGRAPVPPFGKGFIIHGAFI